MEAWLEGLCPIWGGSTINKLSGKCWCCAGSCSILAGEQGREMAPAVSFFLKKPPKDPCPFSIGAEISK